MTLQLLETGALVMVALVLLDAARLKRHDRRSLAAGEALLAALLLLVAGPVPALAAAAVFTVFAGVHIRARRPTTDCGCLGDDTAGSPAVQTALTALTALATGAAAAHPLSEAPLGLLINAPGTAVPAIAAAAAAARVWRVAFALTPAALTQAGDRLVSGSAGFLEQRTTRRSALIRLATAGSALAVAPLRYLLYPGTALGAILGPGSCSGGLCTDGYTAFCCEINRGLNACPTGTFAGGWWKCTDYPGRLLCSEEGIRYYVDCNRIPGTYFPGGCHCAENSCAHRRVNCNVFRYGQCNPQVRGVTEVVCRMILCENPARIPSLNCNASLAVDNAVCHHDAPCLQPAVAVGAAGGV